MKPNRALVVPTCALACASLMGATQASAGSFRYTKLRLAGENTVSATGVDDKDQVVGSYRDRKGDYHGFVWDKGAFTQVDVGTALIAVNAKGLALGEGTLDFTYDIATGQQQTLEKIYYELRGQGISGRGVVVGGASRSPHPKGQGFIAKANGKHIELLTVPGNMFQTFARGINDAGVVVGDDQPTKGAASGFMYQSGTYTSFNPPGAVMTYPTFITDDGVAGGYYIDASGQQHGFTMTGGVFTTIDPPGATFSSVIGIGPAGEVVGTFAGGSNLYSGFIEQGGTFYSINVPGEAETFIQAVNAKGSLVGNYWVSDNNDVQFGFIARCSADQSPCTQ